MKNTISHYNYFQLFQILLELNAYVVSDYDKKGISIEEHIYKS